MLEKSEHKKQLVLGVILVVIFVFLLCSFLYLFLSYTKILNTSTNLVPTPTPTPNPAANWKTYRNPNNKFSFKYPPNLTMKAQDKEGDITLYFPQDFKDREFFDYISIGSRNIPKNITIQVAIEKGYSSVGSYSATEFSFESIKIDGINALANEAPAALNAYDVHFIKDDKLYAFRVSSHDSLSVSNPQRKTFDQILSTFKFLDEKESTEGRTFTGNNFTITLPLNWRVINNHRFEGVNGEELEIILSDRDNEELETEYHLGSQAKQRRTLTLGTARATEYFGCVGVEGCIDMYVVIAKTASQQYEITYEQQPAINEETYKAIISSLKFT